ncbi:MAG: choice-of-anchor Q domain-containing protein [Rhodanobacteraceae bacterium]
MTRQSTGRQGVSHCLRFRKRPLAACLAAAMAMTLAGPALANGNADKLREANHRWLLLSGQNSGNMHLPTLSGRQADMAEAAMQRLLGTQAPSVVTGVTIPVSNCNDSGAGSLRAAVGLAASGDTVDMSGLNCIVNLANSIVTVADDLTIQANPNNKYPYINGQNAIPPLLHFGTGTLTLSGVTVGNGKFSGSNSNMISGGCVFSTGNVVLSDAARVKYCTVENTGTGKAQGGGIYSAGYTSVLSGSVVTGGHAIASSGSALGGGIYAKGGVNIKYGSVVGNSASTASGTIVRGGGIYSGQGLDTKYANIGNNKVSGGSVGLNVGGGAWITGDTTMFNSTVYGNQADAAAAMLLGRSAGTTGIYESTIANNKALASSSKYGGGVYLGNTSTIHNCTITGNTEKNSSDEKYGAGILIKNGVSLEMSSTIVSGNFLIHSTIGNLNSDIRGNSTTPATITGDHNLVGISKFASTPGDTISNVDPKLGPLQDNGGFTLTTAVLPSSAAIDAGIANSNTVDQRGSGFTRTVGAAPDIGTFERGADIIFANGFESP